MAEKNVKSHQLKKLNRKAEWKYYEWNHTEPQNVSSCGLIP